MPKVEGAGGGFSTIGNVAKSNAFGAVKGEAADAAGDRYGSLGRLGAGAILDPASGASAFVKAGVGSLVSKGLQDLSKKKGFSFLSRLFGFGDETNPYSVMVGRGDPQLLFDFAVAMPEIPQDYMWGGGALGNEFVEDIDEPTLQIDDTTQFFNAGANLHIPGFMSVSQFTVRFYGEHKYQVQRYLDAWRRLVVDDSGNYGLPYASDGYAKTISLLALLPDGSTARMAEIYGCFPISRDLISWTSGNTERLILSQTFSANGVRITFPGAEQASSRSGFSLKGILTDGVDYLKNNALKDAGQAFSDTANRFGR